MAASMSAEDQRRQLAGQSPGLGALVQLPQPVAGPGIGLSDVPGLDVVGEGYDQVAEIAAAVEKSYGPSRPQYAPPEVGGIGFQAGRSEPAVRHITNLGADGLLVGPYRHGRQPGGPFTVVSPPAGRPSLWQRLAVLLRRH
jgi:hypothetical protein